MMRASARLSCGVVFLVLPLVAHAADGGVPPSERNRLEALERSESDFKLGVSSQRRGQLEAARKAYASAIERDPGYVEAMVNLARVLAAQGELDEAEVWLDRAASRHSDYPGVPAGRGLVALARDDTDRAVEELTRAHALLPDDVEVLTNLGAALIRAGLWTEAAEHLDRAQRLDPHRSAVRFNLGLAHDRAGDAQRAVFHYRRYLELAASADALRGRVESRLAALDSHRNHSPEDPNVSTPTSSAQTASTLKGVSE